MKFIKIPLSSENENVYLEAYVSDKISGYTRKALLVLPGGGYGEICSEREGEAIAQAFVPYGYNAFVLHYTVGRKKPFPTQLAEVALAIKHIKDNSEEYGINKEELFVIGFSAGGHLAASAGVLWKNQEVIKMADIEFGYNKPTGVMLMYPVISPDYHTFTFNNLLCTDTPSKDKLDAVAIEKHVDIDSAPAFIMHTANDEVVDVNNSLVVAAAYAKAKVPFEMHIYPDAPHGVALGNKITKIGNAKYENAAIAEWVRHAAVWADNICQNKDNK